MKLSRQLYYAFGFNLIYLVIFFYARLGGTTLLFREQLKHSLILTSILWSIIFIIFESRRNRIDIKKRDSGNERQDTV